MELQYPIFSWKMGPSLSSLNWNWQKICRFGKKDQNLLDLASWKKMWGNFCRKWRSESKAFIIKFFFCAALSVLCSIQRKPERGFFAFEKNNCYFNQKNQKNGFLRVFCVWRENHVEMSYFLIKYALIAVKIEPNGDGTTAKK